MAGASFYRTKEWRRFRYAILVRDNFRCVICGADVSAIGAARVDHIKPLRTHPHLGFEPSNTRTLCVIHDAQGHREKGSGSHQRDARFSGATVDGFPLDPEHSWVKAKRITE